MDVKRQYEESARHMDALLRRAFDAEDSGDLTASKELRRQFDARIPEHRTRYLAYQDARRDGQYN